MKLGDIVTQFNVEEKNYGVIIDFSPAKRFAEILFHHPERLKGKKQLRLVRDLKHYQIQAFFNK